MSEQKEPELSIELTPEAEAEGQDPNLVSDPDLETIKEGVIDA